MNAGCIMNYSWSSLTNQVTVAVFDSFTLSWSAVKACKWIYMHQISWIPLISKLISDPLWKQNRTCSYACVQKKSRNEISGVSYRSEPMVILYNLTLIAGLIPEGQKWIWGPKISSGYRGNIIFIILYFQDDFLLFTVCVVSLTQYHNDFPWCHLKCMYS